MKIKTFLIYWGYEWSGVLFILTNFLINNKMASQRVVYSIKQRVAIVRIYYQCGGGLSATLRAYRTQVDRHTSLQESTIRR